MHLTRVLLIEIVWRSGFPSSHATVTFNHTRISDSESVEFQLGNGTSFREDDSRIIIAGADHAEILTVGKNIEPEPPGSWAWSCSVAFLLVTVISFVLWLTKDFQ